MQEYHDTETQKDEISIKEIIIIAKDYLIEIRRFWIIPLLLTIPFVLYMFYNEWKKEVKYTAEVTYMLNNGSGSNPMSGAAGLLGGFGLGGGKDVNLQKIVTILNSRAVISRVLFDKAEYQGKNDFIANHLISYLELRKEWKRKGNEKLLNFSFKNDDTESFSRIENSVLKSLYSTVINGMLSTSVAETGIISSNVSSKDEELSFILMNSVYTNLDDYYVSQTIEKQLTNYQRVKYRKDSLENRMNSLTTQLANERDRNTAVLGFANRLRELSLQRDVELVTTAYNEALRSLEMSKYSLESATPFLQAIDEPMYPLSSTNHRSYIKPILMGIVIGIFLGVVLIVGRKLYFDQVVPLLEEAETNEE